MAEMNRLDTWQPIPLRKTRSVGLSLTQYFAGSPAQAALVSPARLILFVPLRSALSTISSLQCACLDETRQLLVVAKFAHVVGFVMKDFIECTAWRRCRGSLGITNRDQVVDTQRLGNL